MSKLTKQIRYWDFLETITAIKKIMQYKDILPSGLYKQFQYDIGIDNFTIFPPFKYIMPSGLVVEEHQKISLKYPEISFDTVEDYTLVVYRMVSTTTESDATICYYSLVKGYYQQNSISKIPIELKLSTNNEFLILGHLNWDGKYWRFVETNAISLIKNQQIFTPPFAFELINKSSDSNFKLKLDGDFGPIYDQSIGITEILLGYHGIINKLCLRGVGTGEIRVKLLPEAYSYIQTFKFLDDKDTTNEIMISLKDTPTKSNSGVQLRFSGSISLISFAIN